MLDNPKAGVMSGRWPAALTSQSHVMLGWSPSCWRLGRSSSSSMTTTGHIWVLHRIINNATFVGVGALRRCLLDGYGCRWVRVCRGFGRKSRQARQYTNTRRLRQLENGSLVLKVCDIIGILRFTCERGSGLMWVDKSTPQVSKSTIIQRNETIDMGQDGQVT